ncbi:MAG: inositol 2-dehydrogenase [Candidatus Bathyarchaeota archaeon]|nr:inositol 2-dehydrogenase [Candidatus Bathyarchaeota archaeon]
MLKIGIIGAGRIGQIHAENLRTKIRDADIISVADVDKDKAGLLAEKYGNAKWYSDFNEMLEKEDIDAVLICASTSIHKEVIIKAAKKRRHIFCEKPIALTLEETNEAIAAVEKWGVLMQVAFMRRFDPAIYAAKEEIKKGSIGEPLVFKATSRDPEGPPLDYIVESGGLFVDSAIHDIDLARWFMETEVERVYAEGKTLIYPNYKKYQDVDIAFTTLSFKNGKIGSIENSRKSGYGYDTRVEVVGTKGTLQVGYLRYKNYLLLNKSGVNHDVVPSWQERFEDAFINEMKHFVACIINNTSPLVTGVDAKRALEIALAATKSCREGVPVIL